MSIRSKLQEMKQLLSTESKWIKVDFARDQDGQPTDLTKDAVCFCLLGASVYVYHKDEPQIWGPSTEEERNLRRHMSSQLPPIYEGGVAAFNDDTTFEEMHKFLDKCIANAPEDV